MAPSSPLTAPTTTDGAAHAHQGEEHTRATHTQVRSRAYLHVFVRPAARAAACHVGPMCEGVELCGKRVRAVSGRTSTLLPDEGASLPYQRDLGRACGQREPTTRNTVTAVVCVRMISPREREAMLVGCQRHRFRFYFI